MRKHLRILDVLGVGFALALMIIQWGNPALSLAFQAFVIWGVPSQLYRLWQKFNVSRGVLFGCAVALIFFVFGLALLPYPAPYNCCGGDRMKRSPPQLFLR